MRPLVPFLLGIVLLLGPRSGRGCPLPATGQTTCWDNSGTVITCAGTGQDGDLQEGAPLAYVDNGDGTVTDVNTGLMWEKLSNDGTVHDKDNTYTWANAFADHVATLNDTRFAGRDDWRLPNVRELQSIANYQDLLPAVSPTFDDHCSSGCNVTACSCTFDGDYWSSTSEEVSPSHAWFVDFQDGLVATGSKTGTGPVRAVRGGSTSCPLPATGQTTCWDSSGTVIPCAGTGQDGELQEGAPLAYVDNGDGTVTDVNTGLMWEKLSNDGTVHDQDNTYTWANAFAGHVATLNDARFAGHDDWRLPNVRELQSILDYDTIQPAVTPAFDDHCSPGCSATTCSCTFSGDYWSSTSSVSGASNAWFVGFLNANVDAFGRSGGKSGTASVRAVRSASISTTTSTSTTSTTSSTTTTQEPTTTTTTTTTLPAGSCGDVNADGRVDIADALLVAQFDVGLRECGIAPFTNPSACDVNLDGACNIGDALRMAQCDVGLISCAFTCRPFTCP